METIDIAGLPFPASRIGLGTWAIGGWMWGGSNDSRAIRTIQEAVDQGITLIDTAPVYGFGHSEELVGRALEARGLRDRAIIATKCGLEWRDGKVYRNSSPDRVREEAESSLRRLRTDRIDLYQVHWPDPTVRIEETAAMLEQLRREGKIHAIGVSNYSAEQMRVFREIAPIHTVQPPYNLFERAAEGEILPYASDHGITVLAYGALCRGLLAGDITAKTKFEGDDLRRTDPKFRQPRLNQYLSAVTALDRFAREQYGKTVITLAVRWILDRCNTVALWGARRPEQLAPVSDVMGWAIDNEGMQEIERILADAIKDPIGPEFMAPPQASDMRAVA
jgi:aryl-alcohol dehydrogenase-like predicted oxidoreductase